MKKNKQHSKNTGFQVPKDYFKNFEDHLIKQYTKDLQETSPIPPTMESGFSVPKDYFEHFEMKLPQDLKQEKQPSKTRTLFTSKTVWLYTGIAALIALLLTLYTPEKELVNFNTLAFTEIQTYIDEDHLLLSTTEIETILSETITSIDSLDINTLSNDQLVEYLSEEQLEETIIFTE